VSYDNHVEYHGGPAVWAQRKPTLAARPGNLPTLHTGRIHHERRTPPCRHCGYPLVRCDRGLCPRCAMGAEFRAVEWVKR
jgi:ribosomal protein L37E